MCCRWWPIGCQHLSSVKVGLVTVRPIAFKTLKVYICSTKKNPHTLDWRRIQVYTLTHEVFVAFEYGLGEDIDLHAVYTPEDVAYLTEVLPALAKTWIDKSDPDAVAELVECMQYLQLQTASLYREAVDFLLDDANSDGSWGHYGTSERAKMRLYLHTVGVVLQSLFYEFYGPMPTLK